MPDAGGIPELGREPVDERSGGLRAAASYNPGGSEFGTPLITPAL